MLGSNETLTLYRLLCRRNAQGDASFTFYARNGEDAEVRAAEILEKYRFERIELKPWPYEFMRLGTRELPRTIPAPSLVPTRDTKM